MIMQISDELRSQFQESTREGVVVLEADSILRRCTFDEVRARHREITFEHEEGDLRFIRRQDATVWELRLGELVAEENRSEFNREQSALRLAAEAKAKVEAEKKAKED